MPSRSFNNYNYSPFRSFFVPFRSFMLLFTPFRSFLLFFAPFRCLGQIAGTCSKFSEGLIKVIFYITVYMLYYYKILILCYYYILL